MPIVIAERPAIYISETGTILTYSFFHKRSEIPLNSLLIKLPADLRELTKSSLTRLLSKATKLGLPFEILEIAYEKDTEIPTWDYSIIRIALRINKEVFPQVEELFLKEAYADLSPDNAIRVLILLENV